VTLWQTLRSGWKDCGLPDIGPSVRPTRLAAEEIDSLFTAWTMPPIPTDGSLLRAGILLWHDHLDAAHALVQDENGPGAAFIHAIMHRREPDYWNSKYWFHRVGDHPAFAPLATVLTAALSQTPHAHLCQRLLDRGHWRPERFVDLCQEAIQDASISLPILREIQALEFDALLDSLTTSPSPHVALP